MSIFIELTRKLEPLTSKRVKVEALIKFSGRDRSERANFIISLVIDSQVFHSSEFRYNYEKT